MPLLTTNRNTFFKRKTAPSLMLPAADKIAVAAGTAIEVEYALRVGQHCFAKLATGLENFGSIGYFYLLHVQVEVSEIRGVWLTDVDSEILTSQANLQAGLQQLHELGFNTLYPVVWLRGHTLYPSEVARQFTGSAVAPNPKFADRDMLAELIEAAKPYNFRVIPWFEYGLAAPPGSAIDQRHPKLILLDQKNNKIRTRTTDNKRDNFIWLNPCHPQVQQFLKELIVDLVTRYDVDGIQLDDHFCFPVELGYDSYTSQLYRQENGGRSQSQKLNDPARSKWMSAKMTGLLKQIVEAVKAVKPECIISVSPNPLGFAKAYYSTDWQDWERKGYVDELVLQVYRNDTAKFTGELKKLEVLQSRDRIPTAIGILTGIKTRSVSTSLIRQQLQITRENAFAGATFFFYETLIYESLAPTKVARSSTELKQLFPT